MRRDKKIALFAGTTEGRLLAGWLYEMGIRGFVWAATEYGGELLLQELKDKHWKKNRGGSGQGPDSLRDGTLGFQVGWGRLDRDEMENMLAAQKPSLVIDATHPYAVLVSANIREACRAQGIEMIRCLREASKVEKDGKGPEMMYFSHMEEAVSWLSTVRGNVLVTTGSKELHSFTGLRDYRRRIYARVLPVEDSIRLCRELGLEGQHIIGMQGPFSTEMNLALLKEYNCRYLVTKDGGNAGGFGEKLQAAALAGATAVVILRPEDRGISLEEVKNKVKEWMGCE